MDDIQNKKLEALLTLFLDKNLHVDLDMDINDAQDLCAEFLSALSQFDDPKTEPLEVEIVSDNFRPTTVRFINCNGLPVVLYECAAKQEAIDFCKRHGLKIKE